MPTAKQIISRFIAVFFTFIFFLTASCSHNEPPLRVGTNVWPGYEPLYLAREKGFFSQDEIQMVELLSASDVMTAFREGMIDVAALTLDEAITLVAEGVKLKVFLILDISEGADSLVAQEHISDMQQLRGKTIGVEQTAVGAVMLDGAMAKANLELDDIKVNHLTADEHVDAFERGKVDAVVTFEPRTSALLKSGGKILFDSADIPGRIIDVLVMRPEVAKRHPGHLKQLVSSHFKALDLLKKQPDEAARLMAPRLRVEPSEVMPMYNGLVLPDKTRNLQMFADNARSLHVSADSLATILNRAGLIDAVINTTDMFDSTLIPKQ